MTRMGRDEGDPPAATTFWYLATDLYPSLNLILSEAPKREKNNQTTTASGFLKHPTSSRAHDDLVSAFQASPAQLLVAAAGCAQDVLLGGLWEMVSLPLLRTKRTQVGQLCRWRQRATPQTCVPKWFPSPNPTPELGSDASFGSSEPWG